MTFNEIPNSLLVPGFWSEFDNSAAGGSSVMPWNVLLIGAMLSAGTAEKNVPVQIFSDEQADELFGKGSQAARMARAFRKNNALLPCWVAGVADASSGVAAAKTITFGGTATAGGAISLTIAGNLLQIGVASGKTSGKVATAVAAAVNADDQMPVSAAVSDTSKVIFTAKNKGSAGNSILVEVNFNPGEVLPAGITASGSGYLTGGSVDPSVDGVISAISAQWFNIVVTGFVGGDNVDLESLKDEMEARWVATRQQTGVVLFGDNSEGARGHADALNSKVLVCIPFPKSPTANDELAACAAGVIAGSAESDPAMPLGGLALKGVKAPKIQDRKSLAEENAMLLDGGSLLSAQSDGTVYLRRTITTYKTNSAGASDDSYRQLETIFTLSYIRWDWNNYLAGKYPRAKLAQDGFDYGPGQIVMTPKKGRAEALVRFQSWLEKGLVQDYDSFKANLVVEINADNKYRLDFLLPATLMKQLFTCASKIQFR